jgi:hypothetical protein
MFPCSGVVVEAAKWNPLLYARPEWNCLARQRPEPIPSLISRALLQLPCVLYHCRYIVETRIFTTIIVKSRGGAAVVICEEGKI